MKLLSRSLDRCFEFLLSNETLFGSQFHGNFRRLFIIALPTSIWFSTRGRKREQRAWFQGIENAPFLVSTCFGGMLYFTLQWFSVIYIVITSESEEPCVSVVHKQSCREISEDHGLENSDIQTLQGGFMRGRMNWCTRIYSRKLTILQILKKIV